MGESEDARRRALWAEWQERWAAMEAGEPKERFCRWMLGLTLADLDWLQEEAKRCEEAATHFLERLAAERSTGPARH